LTWIIVGDLRKIEKPIVVDVTNASPLRAAAMITALTRESDPAAARRVPYDAACKSTNGIW